MFNAGLQLELSDELVAMRDMVHRFAQDEIAPMAATIDQAMSSLMSFGKRWANLACTVSPSTNNTVA